MSRKTNSDAVEEEDNEFLFKSPHNMQKLRNDKWDEVKRDIGALIGTEIKKKQIYNEIWNRAIEEKKDKKKGTIIKRRYTEGKDDVLIAVYAYTIPDGIYEDFNKAMRELESWDKFEFKSIWYLLGKAVEDDIPIERNTKIPGQLFRGIAKKHYKKQKVLDLIQSQTAVIPQQSFVSSSNSQWEATLFRNEFNEESKGRGTMIVFQQPEKFKNFVKPIHEYSCLPGEEEWLICPWGAKFTIEKLEYRDKNKQVVEDGPWQYIYLNTVQS